MIPGIVMAMGFYASYLQLGVLNTLPGLILADSTLAVPFAVLIFTAFMSGIPDELLQAAVVDGAGRLRTFWSVVLPVSRNSIITVSLFAFLWAWSDFVFASTLAGGGRHQPITLGIYHYIGNNNQQWNAIMATAVVASVPAAALLVLAQRYVSAGVTAGAIKDRPPEPQAPSRTDHPNRRCRQGPTARTTERHPPPMTVAPSGPEFPIQEIPFSHHGSWFDLSPVVAEKTYADDLHLVSHQTGLHAVLRLTPTVAGTTVVATPTLLTWRSGTGRIEAVYDGTDTLRIRGRRIGLRISAAAHTLTPFSGTYLYLDPVDGSHVFTSYETGRRYRITVLSGVLLRAAGVTALGTADRFLELAGDQPWEIAIEEYATARRPYAGSVAFERLCRDRSAEFTAFVEAVAPWRGPDTPAAELAAYVLWSATVAPAGFVTRPAVLMSKHWMDKVWSWDHCFNAIALAPGEPELAWHQFHLPFDHQDESGALPDSVAHSEVLHNYVKPPIHGWALRQLRRRLPQPPDRAALAETYDRLARWTGFWLDARRAPGQDLPHYQHGNDSGWDNATTFDDDPVLQTADLASFLVAQLRCLADLATELGEPAYRWSREADRIRQGMLRDLWDGTRFIARSPRTGRRRASRSLLDLMPVTLGADLPAPVTAALARGVESHLTTHGLATEPTDSAHYLADGYWRGPIWAPSTVLVEDGLRRAGQTGLADDIGRRFLALCEKSGFAENFDAETGAGLRDRAYTWTASSYLILAATRAERRVTGG
ncbi:MGH1-like glycoside hydrolase domain-containing protein [Micromonospora cathayae]|uniref:ABC transporter permease subunit n=1 Tax=Micromonospora cathayae TaxID=3028804 RepID=A0ABY7ZS55_9ACTN|nr:ABC transporter permease subunit [Micromonospora sp. HUAS 3]WDZ85864.1 ABC transporter permease subunit [Micromonospora sp. HUAS 3]